MILAALPEANYTILTLHSSPFPNVLWKKVVETQNYANRIPVTQSSWNHLIKAAPKTSPSTANGKCIRDALPFCRFTAHASAQGMIAATIINHPRGLLSKYQESKIGIPHARSRALYISIKLSTSFCASGSLGGWNSITRRAERGRKIALMPRVIGMRPARAAMLGRR